MTLQIWVLQDRSFERKDYDRALSRPGDAQRLCARRVRSQSSVALIFHGLIPLQSRSNAGPVHLERLVLNMPQASQALTAASDSSLRRRLEVQKDSNVADMAPGFSCARFSPQPAAQRSGRECGRGLGPWRPLGGFAV